MKTMNFSPTPFYPQSTLRRKFCLLYSVSLLSQHFFTMVGDAEVSVLDRTGTMDHFTVKVISDAFEGKNLLDRHRMIYQALDGPMKDGRIHALEIQAKTRNEAQEGG